MDCLYHNELDKRLRECEQEKERSKACIQANEEKIEKLFTYHDELKLLIASTREALIRLEDGQKSATETTLQNFTYVNNTLVSLDRNFKHFRATTEKEISDMARSFQGVVDEFYAFAWFRNKMNWIKENLPWWIATMIMIAIASLFLTWEALKEIGKCFKWW